DRAIPLCHSVNDTIRLVEAVREFRANSVAQAIAKIDIMARVALTGVPSATSVADIRRLAGSVPTYSAKRDIALAGTRVARSLADVRALQDLVFDDIDKDAILKRYLEQQSQPSTP